MIKTWGELGEVLADWENRLSVLENSARVYDDEPSPEPEEKIVVRGLTPKERQEFGQLRAQLKFVENKINEFIDTRKKREDDHL